MSSSVCCGMLMQTGEESTIKFILSKKGSVKQSRRGVQLGH